MKKNNLLMIVLIVAFSIIMSVLLSTANFDYEFLSNIINRVNFDEIELLYTPWLVFFGIIMAFKQLYSWARNRKTGAFIFGMLIQMIMPDPYAERTIEVVQEEKKASKKEQDDSAKLNDETINF